MADPFLALEALEGVPEAIAAARAAIDRLLAHRVLRRKSAEISTEAALRDARASAALDGTDVALEELRQALAAGRELPARLVGAMNVAAALGESLDSWGVAPAQVLARLHVLAVGPRAEALAGDEGAELGRPRRGPAVDDPLGLGMAPLPVEVSARLGGLLRTLIEPTRASALVVAAVVHAELLALRPFGTADGVVARAAERLILVARGLDPKAVGQPGVGHRESGSYADAAARYVAGDPAAFIVQTCRAVELGARESLALAEALQREQ